MSWKIPEHLKTTPWETPAHEVNPEWLVKELQPIADLFGKEKQTIKNWSSAEGMPKHSLGGWYIPDVIQWHIFNKWERDAYGRIEALEERVRSLESREMKLRKLIPAGEQPWLPDDDLEQLQAQEAEQAEALGETRERIQEAKRNAGLSNGKAAE